MLPLLLIIGGAGFGYHKIVVNEKDNRINQQQMEIASATQQNVALQTAAQTNEKTIRNLETQMKKQAEEMLKRAKRKEKDAEDSEKRVRKKEKEADDVVRRAKRREKEAEELVKQAKK